MPTASIKSFATKTGKSVEEVEKLYKEAKAQTEAEYKITKEDEKYYPIVIGILKKMLKIKDSTFLCESCHELIGEHDAFCGYCGSGLIDSDENVPVHAGKDSEKVLRFVKLSSLPKTIQKSYNNGDVYGLFEEDGVMYVEGKNGKTIKV